MIQSIKNEELDLTINSCYKKVLISDIYEVINKFYNGVPTKNVIWDFSNANVSEIKPSEIQILAEQVKGMAHSRQGGKTSIIAPLDITFGLSRMYQIFSDISHPIDNISVFKTLPEAMEWIKE
ncbi:MAG: hypothetical protein P8Y99_07340 [Calditrichaceae bacterium]